MRVLDLFCGAGGAAMGYSQAGFDEIVGVDIAPQPNYPFEFAQLDVCIMFKAGELFGSGWWMDGVDLIHASPPCQEHVKLGANRWGKQAARWPDLIGPTRDALQQTGVPYVIENVVGSGLHDPLKLTGEMFGLTTSRPRLFELGRWFAMSPPPMRRQANAMAIYGKPDGRRLFDRKDGSQLRAWSSLEAGGEAMGIDWMTNELEVREAIPPAYTKFIGEAFLNQMSTIEGAT